GLKVSEGALQRRQPFGFDLPHDKLIGASRRVNVKIAMTDHLLTIFKLEPQPAGDAPPDHGFDLRRFVAEREIDVPRMRPRDFRDFAVDPDRLKRRLE